MRLFSRILAAIVVAAFAVGPVSAAAAPNASTLVAQNASTASISGVIKDSTGAPVPGATVTLTGPQSFTGTTDAAGAFTIADVIAGIYTISATHGGYQPSSESDFAVVAGQDQKLAITLNPASLTSLRTIATVRTVSRGNFNTSTAAVTTLSSASIAEQGALQVTKVLNQLPGTQSAIIGGGVNGAAPGAITVPEVRDARSNETEVLIDGHPVFVGDYGDYVTSFWTGYMWNNVEVVKGPGAMVPQVNGAINGAVNFSTKNPTFDPTPDYSFGFTSKGGSFLNFGFSDTLGKLGFVFDIAHLSDPTPYGNYSAYFSNMAGLYVAGTKTNLYAGSTKNPIPGTSTTWENAPTIVACCATANGAFDTMNELLKFRYKFSGATTATVSYLSNQANGDQFGQTGDATPSTLTPIVFTGANAVYNYTGPAVSTNAVFFYPSDSDTETNNEPIFQGELASTLGDDNIIGRYYHASISRLQAQGPDNPANPEIDSYQLWGNVAPYKGAPGFVGTGGVTTLANYDYYRATEFDKLTGYSFEYQHPIGDNLIAFSYDANTGASNTYSCSNGINSGATAGAPGSASVFCSTTIPLGSTQTAYTYQLRGEFHPSQKMLVDGALYSERYQTITNIASGCNYDGSGTCNFTQENTSHFDGRLAVEYRPDPSWAIRASAGSAIAPPYLSLLNVNTKLPIVTHASDPYETVNYRNPALNPETSFGYDFGADKRLGNDTYVSADIYLNDLFNSYLKSLSPTGLNCGQSGVCSGPLAGNPNILVYASEPVNIANARFEGLELAIKHLPARGFGWAISGSTQRGFAYNFPTSIYCSVPTSVQPCTPATYNQNLNLIQGANFNGGIGGGVFYAGGSATSGISAQNTNVPYLQGNAEIRYTLSNGAVGLFGETLYGKNNSYNEPPFGVAYASLRYPINKMLTVQVSGDNLFNAYPGPFPLVGQGVAIPLVNGQIGGMNANDYGPSVWRFELTKSFP